MVDRRSPFAEDPAARGKGIAVAALTEGSMWQIACWPETFDKVAAMLGAALDCPAPGPGELVRAPDSRRIIRVEPLKWWVLGADGDPCPVELSPDDGATLDMGHDQAGIEIAGERARDLLARMVPIDLRDRALPDGRFATTHMHHMITRVLRDDANGAHRYEVRVMRSYADDLAGLAHHHVHHMG